MTSRFTLSYLRKKLQPICRQKVPHCDPKQNNGSSNCRACNRWGPYSRSRHNSQDGPRIGLVLELHRTHSAMSHLKKPTMYLTRVSRGTCTVTAVATYRGRKRIRYFYCILYHIPYTIYHIPYTVYHIPCTIYHVPYTKNNNG